jgi:hypothetical protein
MMHEKINSRVSVFFKFCPDPRTSLFTIKLDLLKGSIAG